METRQIIIEDTTSGKTITLDCLRILRNIRGRRIVYDGLYETTPVIIKCFTSAFHGRRHVAREIQGLKELTLRHINTARIAAAGSDRQNKPVLVLEKIKNTVDVFSLFDPESSAAGRHSALKAVFACVAQLHEAGILQHDLHTGNFLWDGRQIYVLDPAEMKFSTHLLDHQTSFRQLAMLLASMPKLPDEEMSELLEAYFAERKWPLDAAAVNTLRTLTEQQRLRQMRSMLRKTLRTSKRYIQVSRDCCSGIFSRRLFSALSPAEFMQSIDSLMQSGQVLKSGNTCFVSRIQVNGQDIVVKRYNHKGLWHSLRHTLKGSRAKRCWLFGHRLAALDIPAAGTLGFCEKRKGGLIWQSYILNEFIDGPDIAVYLKDAAVSDETKERLRQATETLLGNLVRFKMTHGDLKATNILVYQDNPVLIDLDSMKIHRSRHLLERHQQKMFRHINERNVLWKK